MSRNAFECNDKVFMNKSYLQKDGKVDFPKSSSIRKTTRLSPLTYKMLTLGKRASSETNSAEEYNSKKREKALGS